ncbi:MAG: carboxypeptidase-like regulatory domain-containing protein, partial [Saprospiraceae bacterium]|nr:carboxypeptidase-like regulatory domain-containing protein [Saprospiraceae bacterium]
MRTRHTSSIAATAIHTKTLFMFLVVAPFFCPGKVDAQRLVRGTVSDASGTPLIGANIVAQRSGKGTATDTNGTYEIEVAPTDSVLTISYTGFLTRHIPIGAQEVINVTMSEELTELDEVQIIGFGTSTRRALTTAVESVDSDVYEGAAKATLLQALQGRVAGAHIIQSTGVTGSAMNI